MCDPLVGGLISGVASIAMGAQQASQLQATQDAQNAANAQWVAYQTQIHNEQVQQENQRRQQAEAARQETLSKIGPNSQKDIQQQEQGRLTQFYTDPRGTGGPPDASTSPDKYALTGQDVTGDKQIAGDLAQKVNQATSLARHRIAALATANSFGGSFGGLGTEIPIAENRGAADINLQNNIRNANLRTYGVQQQVQPIHYEVGSGTEALGGIAKALGGLGGSLTGRGLAGGNVSVGSSGGGFTGGPISSIGPGVGWFF